METKNILVTGGAGFIGSHVSKALASEGHSVSIVDNFNDYYKVQLKRDRLESMRDKTKHVYEFDLNESEKLNRVFEKERFDQVIHLAAQPGVRYSLKAPFKYNSRLQLR